MDLFSYSIQNDLNIYNVKIGNVYVNELTNPGQKLCDQNCAVRGEICNCCCVILVETLILLYLFYLYHLGVLSLFITYSAPMFDPHSVYRSTVICV